MPHKYAITICDFLASGLTMGIVFCILDHLTGGFTSLPAGQSYILIALCLIFFVLYETVNGDIAISNRCLNLLENAGIACIGTTSILLVLALTRPIYAADSSLIVLNILLMLLAVILATTTTVLVLRRISH